MARERSARNVSARYGGPVWIHRCGRGRIADLPQLVSLPEGSRRSFPAGWTRVRLRSTSWRKAPRRREVLRWHKIFAQGSFRTLAQAASFTRATATARRSRAPRGLRRFRPKEPTVRGLPEHARCPGRAAHPERRWNGPQAAGSRSSLINGSINTNQSSELHVANPTFSGQSRLGVPY
jgi:hypothetical protein